MRTTKIAALAASACAMAAGLGGQAFAQPEPFIGQIMYVGFDFCPRGWANADGQLLPISQNQALFALLGTQYGGDGRTTFALPDLRGRVPLHAGQGPGLPDYRQGQRGGATEVTLNSNQMPGHTHTLRAGTERGNRPEPAGNHLANGRTARVYSSAPAGPNTNMDGASIANTGGGQPHENMPPYVTVRACVALTGIFPSRNFAPGSISIDRAPR
ncbi:MAG: tail fiber protein [Pseudomonadota bacterium]